MRCSYESNKTKNSSKDYNKCFKRFFKERQLHRFCCSVRVFKQYLCNMYDRLSQFERHLPRSPRQLPIMTVGNLYLQTPQNLFNILKQILVYFFQEFKFTNTVKCN